MLGTVLRQLGDRDGAISEFREAIRLQPASAEGHLSLGQMLQQRGERAAAAAALSEAARLNQKKADVQASTFAVGVGRARVKAGDVAGAVTAFERAIALAADNFEAHYELAKALTALGRREVANAHLIEARRLAPRVHFADPR